MSYNSQIAADLNKIDSVQTLQLQLSEQNILASWIRNALNITILAFTIFSFISLESLHKYSHYKIYLKAIGISIMLLAIYILYTSTDVSVKFNKNLDKTNYPTSHYQLMARILIIPLIVIIYLFVKV